MLEAMVTYLHLKAALLAFSLLALGFVAICIIILSLQRFLQKRP